MDLYKLFDLPIIGRSIKNKTVQREGGEKESVSLRKYIKKRSVIIDLYTYGSCFNKEFNNGGTVTIGRYCSFGPNVKYFGANHPLEKAIMSAYFYNSKFSGFDVEDVPRAKLEIGHDVWLGANAIITSKCSYIGNGAVVGAGAVVTKDIPAYAIVVGNPGRVIKYRFDTNTIDALEESEWWMMKPEELLKYYEYMSNPIEFAEILLNNK